MAVIGAVLTILGIIGAILTFIAYLIWAAVYDKEDPPDKTQ